MRLKDTIKEWDNIVRFLPEFMSYLRILNKNPHVYISNFEPCNIYLLSKNEIYHIKYSLFDNCNHNLLDTDDELCCDICFDKNLLEISGEILKKIKIISKKNYKRRLKRLKKIK